MFKQVILKSFQGRMTTRGNYLERGGDFMVDSVFYPSQSNG